MFSPSLHAQNKVLGEIELVGASKAENTSSAPGIGDQAGNRKLNQLRGRRQFS